MLYLKEFKLTPYATVQLDRFRVLLTAISGKPLSNGHTLTMILDYLNQEIERGRSRTDLAQDILEDHLEAIEERKHVWEKKQSLERDGGCRYGPR